MGARGLHSDGARLWVGPTWPDGLIYSASHGSRWLYVLGPCTATEQDVQRLVLEGVPDDVAWRWAGSYVTVLVEPKTTTIWTDVGWASPIYITRLRDGWIWASSARLLAALHGGRLDLGQVAARLHGPDAAEAAPERSYFAAVNRVLPARRLRLGADGNRVERVTWAPTPRSRRHAERLRTELEAAVVLRLGLAHVPSTDFSGGSTPLR